MELKTTVCLIDSVYTYSFEGVILSSSFFLKNQVGFLFSSRLERGHDNIFFQASLSSLTP